MSYITRKTIYQELENLRKRSIISYVTSIRPGCSGQMAQDVWTIMIKQINKIQNLLKILVLQTKS